VQVYLDELPAESVCVELYAKPAGAVNACVYPGTAPANRPANDDTARIVPARAAALVPQEANFIL
jgi:hypothetical protein